MEVIMFFLVALLTGTLGAFGQFLADFIGVIGGFFP